MILDDSFDYSSQTLFQQANHYLALSVKGQETTLKGFIETC